MIILQFHLKIKMNIKRLHHLQVDQKVAAKNEKCSNFEIEAAEEQKPMAGDYCSGRKSYYDQNKKTWSKKKVVSEYSTVLKGDERQNFKK